MFRGFVFFSSANSKLLPMTTTKTGIDSNTAIYKFTKEKMVLSMQQVFSFLKKLDSDELRQSLVASSNKTFLDDLLKKEDSSFKHPDIENIDSIKEDMTTITFKAKKDP